MPGIWAVLVPVTPFPATLCPGELRTAERADHLVGPIGHYSERVVCHLRDPLRRYWPCAWPGGPGVVVAAAPAPGCSRIDQPMPRRTHSLLASAVDHLMTGSAAFTWSPRQGRTHGSEGMVFRCSRDSDRVKSHSIQASRHPGIQASRPRAAITTNSVPLTLWVPKTCATWADAPRNAVGSDKRPAPAGPVLTRLGVG
jgi:hypothetical protein